MAKLEKVERTTEIPEGITIKLEGQVISVKGPKGELKREFKHPKVKINIEDGSVKVFCLSPGRKETGLIGTWNAHINNMINGVTSGYEYKMRIIFSHFPIKTSVKGDLLMIENFLGERHPRRARILDGVKAKISGDIITLQGIDKEMVGQTSANIEKATVVRNYDTRVFQDGIYLISRGE